MVQADLVVLDTKNKNERFAFFCGDRIQLQRRCERLEVCCTDFLEICTYCCSRSYCLNFSPFVENQYFHKSKEACLFFL